MVTKDFEPAPVAQLPHGYTVERHAREMVEGHYPNHREYLVAAAYLEQQAAIADHARIVAARDARIALLHGGNVMLQGECERLNEANAALAASLAACRADAERYRALVESGAYSPGRLGATPWALSMSGPPSTKAELDAAIDAARSQP